MLGLPSRRVFCATLLGALSCGPEAFEPEGLPSGGLESEGPVTGTRASGADRSDRWVTVGSNLRS
jgi:hypothetical protein